MKKLKNSELNRLKVEDYKKKQKTPLIIILDNVRSLNNIGSVFRTADAFLVKRIYLCGITAQPPHKDIHKTALGATDSVDWTYVEDTADLVAQLKKEGVQVLAIEQVDSATMLQDFHPDALQEYALVFGNEVKGVQQEVVDLCDACIEIPQFGTKHSFNISVSAGIVMWDIFSKMKWTID